MVGAQSILKPGESYKPIILGQYEPSFERQPVDNLLSGISEYERKTFLLDFSDNTPLALFSEPYIPGNSTKETAPGVWLVRHGTVALKMELLRRGLNHGYLLSGLADAPLCEEAMHTEVQRVGLFLLEAFKNQGRDIRVTVFDSQVPRTEFAAKLLSGMLNCNNRLSDLDLTERIFYEPIVGPDLFRALNIGESESLSRILRSREDIEGAEGEDHFMLRITSAYQRALVQVFKDALGEDPDINKLSGNNIIFVSHAGVMKRLFTPFLLQSISPLNDAYYHVSWLDTVERFIGLAKDVCRNDRMLEIANRRGVLGQLIEDTFYLLKIGAKLRGIDERKILNH